MDVRADRFPLVDSLRGIACLMVIVYHGAFYAGLLDDPSVVTRLLANAPATVPVFFMISAFLLYRPFARARLMGDPQPRTGAYLWRRFLRIVPAYWVALGLAIAVGVAVNVTTSNGPVYFLFGQIYGTSTYAGGLAQGWTLCVEVTFYAMLPVWALAMRSLPVRSRRQWLRQELAALAVLVVISQLYKGIVVMFVDATAFYSQPLLMPLPNFLDSFAIGMAIAIASIWARESGRSWWGIRLVEQRPWLPWAVGALALAANSVVGPSGEIGQELTRTDVLLRHVLWNLGALGIVLPAMLGNPERGVVRRLLGRRWIIFVGLISYGLYLQHLTILSLADRWGLDAVSGSIGAWALWTAVGVAGALALGMLSYYALERPVLSLKRLVPARRRDTAGEAIAEPAPLRPPEPSAAARSAPSQ
jgi:peptidoglycan/LPS O-acetylase OafA/YrhL